MQTPAPLATLIFLSIFILVACSSPAKTQAVHNTIEQPVSTTKATASKKPKKQAGLTFLAQGNSPFWAVDVARNNVLTFRTPESPEGIKLIAEHSAYAKGIEYYGTYKGTKFHLNIRGIRCEDTTVADTSYDMTAKFEFNGKKYTGCAKVK